MCGPYVALCGARIAPDGASARLLFGLRLLFNAGRVTVYAAIGFLAGAFGQIALALGARSGLSGAVAIAAGLFVVLFGVSLMGGVRDPGRLIARSGLDTLIRGGTRSAFRAPPYASAFLLGSLQGAFPCALVYGAAGRAAVAGTAASGAATMIVFGLGTVPAIFTLASMPKGVALRLRVWRGAGVLLVAVGILLVLRGLAAFSLVPHSLFW
jgi:sulfite exporter TauE/SafE